MSTVYNNIIKNTRLELGGFVIILIVIWILALKNLIVVIKKLKTYDSYARMFPPPIQSLE